jgi:hypothetical protein
MIIGMIKGQPTENRMARRAAGKQPCRSSDLAVGSGTLWVAAPAGRYRVDLERLG